MGPAPVAEINKDEVVNFLDLVLEWILNVKSRANRVFQRYWNRLGFTLPSTNVRV